MSILQRGKYTQDLAQRNGTSAKGASVAGYGSARELVIARLQELDARVVRFGYSVLRPTERHYHAGSARDDVFARVRGEGGGGANPRMLA